MTPRVPRPPTGDRNIPSPCESKESAAAYLKRTLGDRADEVMREAASLGAKLQKLDHPSAEEVRRIEEKSQDLAPRINELADTTLGPYMGKLLRELASGLTLLADTLKERPSKRSSEGTSRMDLVDILAGERGIAFAVLLGRHFSAVVPPANAPALRPTQLLAAAVYAGIEAGASHHVHLVGRSEDTLRESWKKLAQRASRIRENMVRFDEELLERQEGELREQKRELAIQQAAFADALRSKRSDKPDGGN